MFRWAFSLLLSAALCMVMGVTPSAAADYPQRSITFSVPGGPGGGFDIYSRALAKAMEKYLPNNVSIVVENMTGAGGRKSTTYIYRSRPDGYTIGSVIFPGVLVSQLVMKTHYDLTKMTWLGSMSTATYVLAVPSKSSFKTLEDLQKAKKPIRFGSAGFGATDFVVDVVSSKMLDFPSVMVSGYKGAAEVSIAAMRGDVDAMDYPITALLQYIHSGDLRPIYVLSTKRSELLPDTPCIGELGHPEVAKVAKLYRLVAAPPNLPTDVKKTLRSAMEKALHDPELIAWSKTAVRPLNYVSGEDVEDIVKTSFDSYRKYTEDLERYATQGR